MRSVDDPFSDALTPDDRRAEVAAVLAAGLVRLKRRLALPSQTGQKPDDGNSAKDQKSGLEVSEVSGLTVQNG